MKPFISSAFLFGLVMSALCWVAPQATHAQDVTKPQIKDLRIGFDGAYKLGSWTPVEVDLQGGSEQLTGQVIVTAPDSDGVPVSVSTPSDRPVGVTPQSSTTVRLFIRVGKSESSIKVAFVVEGKVRAERTFHVGIETDGQLLLDGLPATSRLHVQFGPALGLGMLVKEPEDTSPLVTTTIRQLSRADQLPTEWYGYEGVDTVLLTTSEVELYRPLLQSTKRVDALFDWVQHGGRLALFCGQEAEELLGEDGVLTRFVPGKFDALVPLRQSLPLESFSGSDEPLSRNRRISLQVPKLIDVHGQILASSGGNERDLPLVIRSRLGLGEVVFVGLDFDRPPLADWKGRNAFLRKALDWPRKTNAQQKSNSAVYDQPADMSAKLRNALDSKFAGVSTIPFFLVGALVVGYILLIGPGDYFFVSRVLKRAELTWITFPVIVASVSVGAYFLAAWLKGDQMRVNQVEIVDVVTSTGQVRGTVWTHFFTPRVEKFDLSLEPKFLGESEIPSSEELVSWLGLPGYSQGGMQDMSGQATIFDRGYRFDDSLSTMLGVPVQLWSTKTLAADWQAKIDSPLQSELRPDGEELVAGQITNSSGTMLEDAVLLYGTWAYYLGKISPDGIVNVDDDLQPRTVKTSLTSATAGDTTEQRTADDGTVPFRWAESDVSRLLKATMFFEAINGQQYTGSLNRYLNSIDLSHLLKQKDVAILLAKTSADSSQWMNGVKPLASDEDRHWTYYRFVLPVNEETPNL